MPLLTPAQLREIRRIVERHHAAFIASAVSPEAIDPQMLAELRAAGLVPPAGDEEQTIREAYLYGVALSQNEDKATANMSLAQFREHMKRNPVPLSPYEREGAAWASQRAAEWIVGLGNRIATDTVQTIVNADDDLRRRTEATVRQEVSRNVLQRETIQQLASELGWRTGDWARDWDRIAASEKQNALLYGQADHYASEFGFGVEVFRRPGPDACKECKWLHLGPDGHPRIFTLEELEGNGSNFHKKRQDWRPVLGAIHPNCKCPMHRVPAGFGFNEDGDLVPGGKLGTRYGGPEDLQRALRQEMDLLKAVSGAGNRLDYQGIPVVIESPAGSVRRWEHPDGSPGETLLAYSYGYAQNTSGMDDDEVDVYVGPDPRAPVVYVVTQQNPHTGTYDEQKCMLGFTSERAAVGAYKMHLDEPDRFYVDVQAMPIAEFKRWLSASRARPGEYQGGETKLVLPLSKGVKGRGEMLLTGYEPRGDRGPTPSGVAGVNLVLGLKRRDKPVSYATDEAREYLRVDAEHQPRVIGDFERENYEFLHEVQRRPRPVELDDQVRLSEDERTEMARENREQVDREYESRKGPVNRIPSDDDAKVVPLRAAK